MYVWVKVEVYVYMFSNIIIPGVEDRFTFSDKHM